jgi:hypothetical protein
MDPASASGNSQNLILRLTRPSTGSSALIDGRMVIRPRGITFIVISFVKNRRVINSENAAMSAKQRAAEKKPSMVVANDPEDPQGRLKSMGGSQSDHWKH